VIDIQNPQIEIRCAWCDKENGVVPRSHYSHGICVMHRDRMMNDIALFQTQFLAKKIVPVMAQIVRRVLE